MRRCTTILALLALAACHSDSTGLLDAKETMTASVDGENFVATSAQVTSAGGGTLSLVGSTSGTGGTVRQIGLAVNSFIGRGAYDLGPANSGTTATYTSTPSGGAASQWSTSGAGSSGSITITIYTSERVAGTFQFTGTADAGTAATGTVTVTNGAFDLSY